jgi:cytochrome c-type biogenesis protein CcmH
MTSLLAFWLSAGVLTTAAVAVLLAALLRRPREESPRADYDLGIYRDQLAELDRDMDRGVLSVDQAAAARTEIERRMLLAAEAPAAVEPAASRRGGIATAVGLAVALPASALALYLTLGSPGTESQPFAGRELAPGEDPALSAALIEQISDRIAEDPHDIEAWLLLARLHRATERYGEAAEAYRQVVSLSPGNPEAMSSLGEMLVAAADGEVTGEARQVFGQVLAADPGDPRALYYAGLALAQDGLTKDALAVWRGLLEGSPGDAPWVPLVSRQIEQAARDLGADAADLPPVAPSAPSASDVEAAREMSEDERNAFVRSMVERLAARLEESPEDPEGWLRLARAYRVLGEGEKSAAALAEARTHLDALPADGPERQALEEAFQALSDGQ